MQAGGLGSVPPMGVSRWTGTDEFNRHRSLRSPCSAESWTIAQTQRHLYEAPGKCPTVTGPLRRQAGQLRICVPADATS
jgi:hypothetical protein